jgi:hypothetical protein
VPVVETALVGWLIGVFASARLLGSYCALVGVSFEVALALVIIRGLVERQGFSFPKRRMYNPFTTRVASVISSLTECSEWHKEVSYAKNSSADRCHLL